MLKNGIALLGMFVLSFSLVNADVVEIDCSTSPIFSQYSCNQCFDGGEKGQGEYIGLLSDLWVNATANSKLMYKEVQVMPTMFSLDTSKVVWTSVPSANNFWEYTPELEALYSSDFDGYVLPAGGSVVWLKSRLDSAFRLDRNEVARGGNIGLLVYTLSSAPILDSGEIGDFSDHNECVLYRSGAKTTPPPDLPKTGPAEFFLLLILAMVLGFGVLKYRSNANS